MTFIFALVLTACSESTVSPTQGNIVEAVYGLGTVESEQIYHARSGVQVTVQEFYVSEGQDVKRGQKLFKIEQGIVYTSPIAGRVTEIPTNVKENISPQSLILTVINLEKLYLSVALEQHAAMKIKRGLKTEISFEFFRNRKIKGRVDTFYPKRNEFIAKVVFESTPDGILPGMTADVAFEIARKNDVILLPTKVLSNGHITVLKNSKKQRILVQVGLADLEKFEVLEPPLSTDTRVLMP